MQLAELLKDWPCNVKGDIRTIIESVSDNSKRIGSNTLFCAIKGEKLNGYHFIQEAIENGAVCLVVEDERYYEFYSGSLPIVWVPNLLKFIAYTAATLAGHPSEALTIIAVTGTNGKTTTTHFIEQYLRAANKQTLLIGTNGIFENGIKLDNEIAQLTTMQPIHFHQLLSRALHKGIEYVVLEASSQGLATYRLDYTDIDVGVFLNLHEDHIEWHGSLEKYKQAKLRLSELSNSLVVNGHDSFCKAVGILSKKEKIIYNTSPKSNFFYEELNHTKNFSHYIIQYEETEKVLTFPFNADFLIENVMAAIAACLKCNIPIEAIERYSPKLHLPNGRMQHFLHPKGTEVIVDYAHTHAALEAILKALKSRLDGELILVFSCGGNRDQLKRVKMGEVASQYADFIYLTTDNCRDENPLEINYQIMEGFLPTQNYEILLDRKSAIERAISKAKSGDVVVIAGKGHEQTQINGNQVLTHSDIEIVQEIVNTKNITKENE